MVRSSRANPTEATAVIVARGASQPGPALEAVHQVEPGSSLHLPVSEAADSLPFGAAHLRAELTDTLAITVVGDASIDDWEQHFLRLGRATRYRSPHSLMGDPVSDIGVLRRLLLRATAESTKRRLAWILAQLSGAYLLYAVIMVPKNDTEPSSTSILLSTVAAGFAILAIGSLALALSRSATEYLELLGRPTPPFLTP